MPGTGRRRVAARSWWRHRVGRVGGAVAAACLLATAAAAAANGLRGTAWGDDRATLLARIEAEPVVDSPGLVIVHERFAGMDVVIGHRFDAGALWQLRYFNRARHRDPLEYLVDFTRVKRQLTAAWGEPDIDTLHWHDDTFRDRPIHYHGQLVAAGDLAYVTGWATQRARVIMTLRGEKGFRIAHRVTFTDPDIEAEWPFGVRP